MLFSASVLISSILGALTCVYISRKSSRRRASRWYIPSTGSALSEVPSSPPPGTAVVLVFDLHNVLFEMDICMQLYYMMVSCAVVVVMRALSLVWREPLTAAVLALHIINPYFWYRTFVHYKNLEVFECVIRTLETDVSLASRVVLMTCLSSHIQFSMFHRCRNVLFELANCFRPAGTVVGLCLLMYQTT